MLLIIYSIIQKKASKINSTCLLYLYLYFFLAEADAEVKSTGRADEENNPSALVQTLTKLMSEFADIFKSGLSSFFRNAKEGEDSEEETDEEESGQEEASQNRRSGGNQVEGNKRK